MRKAHGQAPATPGHGQPIRVHLRPVGKRLPCPHCQSTRTEGHGGFTWKDGTWNPRSRCRSCGRTFCKSTGTALHYIKKRSAFADQADGLGAALSIRAMAAKVGVSVATAFNWRHRVLTTLVSRPQAKLTGTAALGHIYVRYSEKGSRKTDGPGSHNALRPVRTGKDRFRRLADGKASCVLLGVDDTHQRRSLEIGRGCPTVAEWKAGLAEILHQEAKAWAEGRCPHAAACQELGIPAIAERPRHAAQLFGSSFFAWLLPFRGIATRYLANYLTWHRFVSTFKWLPPWQTGRQMLAEASVRP